MATLIHPDDLIHRLRLDRRRCFVITGHPGEGKSRLAKAMAKRYDGHYLDLLSTFVASPDLAADLDTFTSQRFKAFLQKSHATGDLILIDEMEFLWHRWDSPEKREFLNILKLWSKSAFFGVFLPPGQILETFVMPDQDGQSRILSLHDLQTLE